MTPAELFAEIEAQPPLMRPKFAKKYVGMVVDWPLQFANAWKGKSKTIRTTFRLDTPGLGMIMGDIRQEVYPQLEHLHAREPLRVRGRIRSVSTLWIELDITELLFCIEAAAV